MLTEKQILSYHTAIASSILTIAYHAKTHGEIIVARTGISHYLRTYGHLFRSPKTINYVSLDVIQNPKEKTIEDHLVPLKVLSDTIISLPMRELTVNAANISAFMVHISDHLNIIKITKHEDRNLRKAGFADSMPLVTDYLADKKSGNLIKATRKWGLDDSPFPRYDIVGISLHEQ